MGELVTLADYRRPALPAPIVTGEQAYLASLIKPKSEWQMARAHQRLADAERDVAYWEYMAVCRQEGKDSPAAIEAGERRSVADDWFQQRTLELLFIAAPTVGALRFKERLAETRHHKALRKAKLIALAMREAGL